MLAKSPVMVNIGLGSVFPLKRSATGRVSAAFMAADLIKASIGKNPQNEACTKPSSRSDKEGWPAPTTTSWVT